LSVVDRINNCDEVICRPTMENALPALNSASLTSYIHCRIATVPEI